MKTLEVHWYRSVQTFTFLTLEDLDGIKVVAFDIHESVVESNGLIVLMQSYIEKECCVYSIEYLKRYNLEISEKVLEMAIPINTLKAFLLLNNTEMCYA